MTKISDIIRKIKARRARAADSASSEAEAAKAAAVADKLLREHNIDLSELDVRAEGVDKTVWGEGQRILTPESWALANIGRATGARVWVQNGGEFALLGSPADVEVALYYLDLVSAAAASCLSAYQRTEAYREAQDRYGLSRRKINSDYKIGVCQRLGERIREQAEAERAPEATGTGIIVVKDSLINQWLKDRGIGLAAKKPRRRALSASYRNGREAAENVGIGRGVGARRSGVLALR